MTRTRRTPAPQVGSRAGIRRLGLVPGLLVALWSALLPVAAAGDAPSPAGTFRRGASIQTLLGWGQVRADDPSRYADEPFAGPQRRVPDQLLRDARRSGLDFIRLAVDPGPFLQLTGPARDRLDATLLRAVLRLRGFGFAVIVDFAPNPQVAAFDRRADVVALDAPAFRRYTALVRRTARLLGATGDAAIALEPMNEPDIGYDPASRARWQAMLEILHGAARAEAPAMPIVLTGGRSSARDALEDIDPASFRDDNVLFTFHYYEPLDFTHQGVGAGPGTVFYRRYLGGMPYPASTMRDATGFVLDNVAADPTLGPAARRAVIAEALRKAAAYQQGGLDRRRIREDFDGVAAWAGRHGIPAGRILIGEFGVARFFPDHGGADAASVEGWLRDVRQEAEAHGFGWAVWALAGGTFMGITTQEEGTTLDPAALAALGLRDPGAAAP